MSTRSTTGNSAEGRNYRSAKTGRYVTPDYAKRHPGTTVAEPRRPKRK